MHERITKAYDAIMADATQCRAAQTAALAALHKRRSHNVPVRRWAVSTAAVALAAVILVIGYAVYTQPVAVISIEGETAVELQVNRFDRVVALETESDETTVLPRFARYTDAVQAVTEAESDAQVTVFSQDGTRCEAMLDNLQNERCAPCRVGDADVIEQAAKNGLPCGKYAAFLQWQALDPTATAQKAQSMTMREIREAIATLSETEQGNAAAADDTAQCTAQSQPCGSGNGQGNGQGNGNGQGRGHGQGNGQGNGYGHGQGQGKQKGK